jgi:hypothetical protein
MVVAAFAGITESGIVGVSDFRDLYRALGLR